MIATLLSYVVIALTCGVLGLLLAGWLAAACVSWYRISSFEGKAGYFVVFTALLGAIVAMGIALITTGVVASTGSPWFLRSMAFSLGLVVSAAAGAAMACRLLADIPPTIDGCELDLEVEVRQPAGETVGPAGAAWSFWLGSVVRRVQ